MSDEQLELQKKDLQELSAKFPNNDPWQIYMLDCTERLLTNSRDQTKYLKNISGIITALVILAVIGWIITLFL